MNRTFKAGSTAVTLFGVLGILGAGCLSRPVTNAAPQVNTNFTAVVHNQSVDKVDLLFMIDNSASMGDKQALLALAVPDMINRLVAPNCLDANNNPNGMTAAPDGTCGSGKAEFPPVHDMHIGVVTSSLGGRGGDQCDPTATNPANGALNAHNDDKGELINRGGVSGNPTVENSPAPDLNSSNFLSWFPAVTTNQGHPAPLPPAVTATAALVSDFATIVEGIHEHGCGFEAQNEAWYRFLVQPDPFDSITKVKTQAQLTGLDATILQQRHDFLRSDSLLAIIVVTDENEEAADPLSIGAQGWAFDNQNFPGSPNGASPQGTTDCLSFDPNNPTTTGPNSSSCTSCAFVSSSDPSFASRCPKDGATGSNGYLDPTDDTLNTRFYHQKLRFGLFAGYPTSRYVRGMQSTTVPDSAHEHDSNGNYIGDQDANANCVNPIYAQNLPTSGMGPTDPTLCNLTRGTRTPDLVYYAAIAGVPHQLLQATPGDGTCPTGTAAGDCPQKDTLTDADWKLIEGNDPENYDFSGADFHMVENWDPRTTPGAVWSAEEHGPLAGNIMAPAHTSGGVNIGSASACPPTMGGSTKGAPLCDAINGREWATNKGDLQFSCIFDITPQYGNMGKDCSNMEYQGACDCSTTSINNGTQLCDATTPTLQIYGKAYPSVREMVIAKAMSNSPNNLDQGIVSSLCPIHVSDNATNNDPLFGYRPAVNAIINRLKASLSNQCLPQKLVPDSLGIVPCLILVQLGTAVGPGSCANPGAACVNMQGLLGPGDNPQMLPNAPLSQDVLTKFCEAQEGAYTGMPGGPTDPDLFPACALEQLLPVVNGAPNTTDFPGGAAAGCSTAPDSGWCYVTGAAANGCPQAILFTNGEPPHGSTVSLQCIEQSVQVVDGGVSSGSSSSGSGSGGGGD